MTSDQLQVETAQVTGSLMISDQLQVETAQVTGSLMISDQLQVETAQVTGSLMISDQLQVETAQVTGSLMISDQLQVETAQVTGSLMHLLYSSSCDGTDSLFIWKGIIGRQITVAAPKAIPFAMAAGMAQESWPHVRSPLWIPSLVKCSTY